MAQLFTKKIKIKKIRQRPTFYIKIAEQASKEGNKHFL